jgi:hypothetical protein
MVEVDLTLLCKHVMIILQEERRAGSWKLLPDGDSALPKPPEFRCGLSQVIRRRLRPEQILYERERVLFRDGKSKADEDEQPSKLSDTSDISETDTMCRPTADCRSLD